MSAGAVFDPLLRSHASGWPTAAELVESEQPGQLPPAPEADEPRPDEALQVEAPGPRESLSFADECRRRVLDLIRALVPGHR